MDTQKVEMVKYEGNKYSVGEEIANAITHGIGAVFSIVALILMIVRAAGNGDAWQVVSVSIYGAMLVVLYTMSTLYHALFKTRAHKVFKILDHASVYLLIAGTYTPVTLITLRQVGAEGWIIFSVIWGLTISGIILSTLFIGKFRVLKTIVYLIMGWMIILAFPDMVNVMKANNAMFGIYLMIAGGIFYSVGTLFYLNKKIKYFHSIWHVFVLLGTVCHFVAIMFYVL